MLSPYRLQPNRDKSRQKISNTNLDDNSNREHDLKGSQMMSKESSPVIAKVTPNTSKRCKLKGGSSKENFVINDEKLDESLHINNF